MEYEGIYALDVYEKIRDDVQKIYRSRLQTEILLTLIDNNKTLSQLRGITGSSSQTVIPKIRKLESMHLLERQNHEYTLTSLGKVIAYKIADFSRSLGVINLHSYFWTKHHRGITCDSVKRDWRPL